MNIYLGGSISKGALHLFVHQGRHGVKDHLGMSSLISIDHSNQKTHQQISPDGKLKI